MPSESFAELAFELRLIARDKAAAAESCEQLIAAIETERFAASEGRAPRPLELTGMRDALADLERRARLAGRSSELLEALAAREDEIRKLFAVNEQQPAAAARP